MVITDMRNQRFFTDFVLFCQNNPNFVKNQHISYLSRIVSQKESQFRKISKLFFPFWHCFPERIPISQNINTFLTFFVLFPRKNANFAKYQHFSYLFRIVSQKECQFRKISAHFLPFSYCFPERSPISQNIKHSILDFKSLYFRVHIKKCRHISIDISFIDYLSTNGVSLKTTSGYLSANQRSAN